MSLNERALHETAGAAADQPVGAAARLQRASTPRSGRARTAATTPEGDVRRAFFLSYDDSLLRVPDARSRSRSGWRTGEEVVSATFVTPYPPGFPVLVPGQMFSREILEFMRSLDTPEIHGLRADLGYRVYIDKALEIAAPYGASGANSRPKPRRRRCATRRPARPRAARRTAGPRRPVSTSG